jgi:hypothetical protein
MKKKYYAPEMEELKFDEPVVLEESTTSTEKEGGCPDNEGCGAADI